MGKSGFLSIITRGNVRLPDTDFFWIIPWWSHFFGLPPSKNIFCITPWWVFVFDLGISTKKGKISTSGKSGNLLEDQEKSGKFDVFWKKSGKSKWRRLLSMQIFNFKKNMCMQKCVQLNCIWQSVVYMMLLFASSIKMI